jgi:hypothetical protein
MKYNTICFTCSQRVPCKTWSSAIMFHSCPRSCKHGTHLTFPFAFLSAWLLPQFRTCLKCTLIQDGKQFNIVWHLRILNTWHINKIARELLNILLLTTTNTSFYGQYWRNALWEAATIDMPTNIWNFTILRRCAIPTCSLKIFMYSS